MSYFYYILGCVLLTLPAGVLTHNRLEFATLAQVVDRSRFRLGWLHWQNLVDLIRAWAGLTLVRHAFAAVDPAATGSLFVLAICTIVALAGLGIQQILHPGDEDDLIAPVAYLMGLLLAFIPLPVALLAIPLGTALTLGLRSLDGGFILGAVATAGLGYFMRLSPVQAGTAALLLFWPAFFAAITKRRLVLTVRNRAQARTPGLRDISARASHVR